MNAVNTIEINYDLVAPGRDYSKLSTYLKSFNGYSHALESLWLVRTTKSAVTVRDEIKQYVDANDKVLVLDVTNDAWATLHLSKSTNEWLQGHMSSGLKAA
jgi:hypothetical protein